MAVNGIASGYLMGCGDKKTERSMAKSGWTNQVNTVQKSSGRKPADSIVISQQGRNALREMVSQFGADSNYADIRGVTAQNTNETAWEHYTAMRELSSQTLKDGNYDVEDVMRSIIDTYESRCHEIIKEHENGDREVSYELTGKRALTLEEDLAGLDEAYKMRLANLEGYITCKQTNKAYENPDSSWYFHRNNLQSEEKISEMKRLREPEEIKKLSPVSFYTILNNFEKEEWAKTDSFDLYVNKMASAYQLMKGNIEEKYAVPDREAEYYVSNDGSIQELTKEKELEMLDKAYETHSRFMAVNTQIWGELQDFKVQIVYHSGSIQEASAAENQRAGIKEQAYNAFMSAINLHVGISDSERNVLNSIWNYYANKR